MRIEQAHTSVERSSSFHGDVVVVFPFIFCTEEEKDGLSLMLKYSLSELKVEKHLFASPETNLRLEPFNRKSHFNAIFCLFSRMEQCIANSEHFFTADRRDKSELNVTCRRRRRR